MQHIKMCGAFSPCVRLTIQNDAMKIENLLDHQDPRLYSASMPIETNIEAFSSLYSIKGLQHIFAGLEIEKDSELIMHLDIKCVRSDGDDRFMVMARTVEQDGIPFKLKVEEAEAKEEEDDDGSE